MECLMLQCQVWYFVGGIEQVEVLRKDEDSDHAECVRTRTIAIRS